MHLSRTWRRKAWLFWDLFDLTILGSRCYLSSLSLHIFNIKTQLRGYLHQDFIAMIFKYHLQHVECTTWEYLGRVYLSSVQICLQHGGTTFVDNVVIFQMIFTIQISILFSLFQIWFVTWRRAPTWRIFLFSKQLILEIFSTRILLRIFGLRWVQSFCFLSYFYASISLFHSPTSPKLSFTFSTTSLGLGSLIFITHCIDKISRFDCIWALEMC